MRPGRVQGIYSNTVGRTLFGIIGPAGDDYDFFLQQSTSDAEVNYLQWPGEIETQDENETIEFVRGLLARARCMRCVCAWFYE